MLFLYSIDGGAFFFVNERSMRVPTFALNLVEAHLLRWLRRLSLSFSQKTSFETVQTKLSCLMVKLMIELLLQDRWESDFHAADTRLPFICIRAWKLPEHATEKSIPVSTTIRRNVPVERRRRLLNPTVDRT